MFMKVVLVISTLLNFRTGRIIFSGLLNSDPFLAAVGDIRNLKGWNVVLAVSLPLSAAMAIIGALSASKTIKQDQTFFTSI